MLDYVRLDGVPSCLPNHLVAWCAEKSGTPGVCRPLPNRRRCIPVKLTQSTATSVTAQALERSRELVALLSNSSDSNSSDPFGDKDAPNDQSVIVRVAAIDVAGGCDALTDTTKSLVGTDRKVVGCARSCPVTLDVSQDVALDFGDPTCTHLDDCAELSTPSATP